MPSATLVVHEHERLVIGQAVATRDGTSVPFTQGWFDLLARFVDRTGSPAFRLGYRKVTVAHHVGYLRVGPLRLEILPKLASTELPWRDLLVHMINEVADVRLNVGSPSSLHKRPRDLFELLVMRFVELSERIVRDGLASTYREVEENGTVLRGRLLVPQHVRANTARQERVFTAYEVFDPDNPPNRILHAALRAVARTSPREDVTRRAEQLTSLLPDFEGRIHARDFDRVPKDRRMARYGEALTLARMLLFGERPDLRWGDVDVVSLLFDMNHLFESYVAARTRRVPAVRVRSQSRLAFWRGADGAGRILKPDLIIHTADARTIVLDTKWKRLPDGRPSDEDLRQLYAYVENVDAHEGFLVYPTAEEAAAAARGHFVRGGRHGGVAVLALFKEGRVAPDWVTEQMRTLVAASP
jgi:5-methylcytosine-specific restriction enzyme subunit McrC